MGYFPQLVTGAAGQFPGTRTTAARTVVNEAADGRRVKLGDPTGGGVEWKLDLKGLTDAEWEAIEALFESVEGRLKTFTFLDPFDNLLRWSEDLSAGAWVKGAGLALTPGVTDPKGGTNATRVANGGAGPERLGQIIAAPSQLRYAMSVYARSAAPARVTLYERSGAGTASRELDIGPAWRRLEHTAQLATVADTVEFGVSLPAGVTAEFYGFQAEAQVGASGYKKTTSRSGVHAEASFREDTLTRTTNGRDDNACVVRIRADS
jgi:hypothetical protein